MSQQIDLWIQKCVQKSIFGLICSSKINFSRYQSDMSKANLEKVAKFFRFDEFLRGLTIFFERLYGVKVRLGRSERGESWETAELKIVGGWKFILKKLFFQEICTQKDELLGVIYINADVRTKPFGRITLSEWNLDNTKDVQFYVVRRPKLVRSQIFGSNCVHKRFLNTNMSSKINFGSKFVLKNRFLNSNLSKIGHSIF